MSTATDQGNSQKNTVAGATQVTKSARLIVDQADIGTITEIPDLPAHQQAAKTQSNTWTNDIWPLIIQTTAEIIDYANTFQSSYDQLKTLVPKLEAGDAKAKSDFIEVLNIVLIPTLQDKTATAKSIAEKVSTFHADFQPLYTKFQADFTKANDLMTKDNLEILDKQADQTAWRGKALGYEMGAVAAGIALPITIAATFVFAETGVGILIGGILIAGELAAIGTLLGEYADAMHHVNDLTSDIAKLKVEVAQLTLIENQITDLQSYTKTVVATSADVADGWTALKLDLDNTIAHLDTITPEDAAIIINIQLDAANKEWGVVLGQATALQPTGGALDAETVATSADMLAKIDAQAAQAKGA